MQAISTNVITQGRHLVSNAVDYAATPDPIIYAPEDVTFVSFGQKGIPGTKTDAGLALRAQGASGLHQFAHCSETILKSGTASRGQPIAIMGHTGYTIPDGPEGAHCHWWIRRKDGSYVYPPSIITQGFIKLEEDEVLTQNMQDHIYLYNLGRLPDKGAKKDYVGKPGHSFDDEVKRVRSSQAYKQHLKDIKNSNVLGHFPGI